MEQVCFEGCAHTEEYPRAESYKQLLGTSPLSEVPRVAFPTTTECEFESAIYGIPVSVEFFDSRLDASGNIRINIPMIAPYEQNGVFTGTSISGESSKKPAFEGKGDVLHGVSIRATWENGDIFEYRFIARTDEYK